MLKLSGPESERLKKLRKFQGLIKKIDCANPKMADVKKAEAMLMHDPHMHAVFHNLSDSINELILDRINIGHKATSVLCKAEMFDIKEELGYSSSPQIEKLIVEEAVSCWIMVNYFKERVFKLETAQHYKDLENPSLVKAVEYYRSAFIRYHNQFLRVIETLVRVRKISKSIPVQINIAAPGGQQVNVNELNSGKQ